MENLVFLSSSIYGTGADYVNDAVTAANYAEDIDDQGSGINYTYDAIGNIITDAAEGSTIEWNLQGKVKKINKPNGVIDYFYDAKGNLIAFGDFFFVLKQKRKQKNSRVK